MAALDAGTYRLRHGVSAATPSTKRLIFVKLTDSAQTALEDLKSSKQERTRATFHFGEKDGCIRLPNGDVFNFRLDEIPNNDGPQGSFECIQTIRKGEVEHLSDIKHRITVQATEASFENYGKKITMAEELSKKQCAKKIETSGPNISQRSKVLKRPGDPALPSGGSSHKKPRPEVTSGVSPHNSPFGRTSHPVKPAAPANTLSSSQPPVIAPFPASSQKRPPPPASASQPPPPNSRTSSSSSQAPLSHSSSFSSLVVPETLSGNGTTTASSRSPLVSSARSPVAQPTRPLRERLIQTLALKPMTRPELIAKLKKYGYKDEERTALEQLLLEVTTSTTSKDGVELFDLATGCFSQVDAKWSLFSPADSLMANTRLSRLENRPSGSSSAATASQQQPPALHKTSSASDLLFPSYPAAAATSSSSRPGTASSKSSKSNSEMDRLQNEVASARVSLAHPNPGDDLSPPPPSSSSTCSTPSPPDHSKLKEIGNKNSTNNKSSSALPVMASQLYGSSQDDSAAQQSERENFDSTMAARYRTIQTPEQRRQYKNEFYLEYNEYKELHGQMAQISDQFTSWETKLRDAVRGSSEYQRIAELMRNEYKRLKKDDDYTQKRNRWDGLFKKLTLIKQRIKAYDVLHKKV